MKNHITIPGLGLCLLLSACGTIVPSYFGDKFPPTNSVEIYYSAHDIKQDYKVIGHLTITNIGQDSVKSKLKAYGKTIGADAIVILGNTVDNGSKGASDVVNADAVKYDK
jgi:hypothetical protein